MICLSLSRDPSSFDFLSQAGHSEGHAAALALARQSLYVKFDPLIAGRPSIMPGRQSTATTTNGDTSKAGPQEQGQAQAGNNNDLIAMNSPSPPSKKTSVKLNCTDEGEESPAQKTKPTSLTPSQQLEFQEQLLKKDSQIAELDKLLRESLQTNENLRNEAKQRRESEDQMKQVMKEYEKTISELIAEKEKEKQRFEDDKSLLMAERDQARDLQTVQS